MKLAIKIALGVVVSLVIIAALTTIIVVTTTVNYGDRNKCETIRVPYSLDVQKRNGDFVVSWYVPSGNGECNVIYLLRYNIEGGPEFKVNITDNNYILENVNLEGCAILQLQMWAISETGFITESSVTRNYTDLPHGSFTDPEFTDVSEGLLVTWIKPIELTGCNVHYNFSITSELGSFMEATGTERVIVPFNIYCFRGRIVLKGMVGNNERATIIYFYREVLRRIQGITARVSSDDPTELIITWNKHRKEETCSIVYEVEFYTDEMEDQFLNVTTPKARFNFIHCVGTLVQIRTFGLNRATEGPYAIEEIFECEGMK